MLIILKTDYFQLGFLYKKDLRISNEGEQIGNVGIKPFFT